jgi:UDPglucose--hexose-1-phosphate uridylyltransferase
MAAARQNRTFMPNQRACPLCPSVPNYSSEIPAAGFELAVFENRFPAMRSSSADGGADAGVAEVVVYTDRHDGSFASLPLDRVRSLVEVWTDRYCELASRRDVRYVFIFENRGEAVGVTLHHPHGQVYGYPFIPPAAEIELRAGRLHARQAKGCLQCHLVVEERQAGARMLFVRGGIAAYVPAYARWPFEVHVAPIQHRGALPDLILGERASFGEALQEVVRGYDRLFGTPMPYMMAMHQKPTDGHVHPEAHLHVEFYPLLRDIGRLKYLAAGECGAGTFVSDCLPEERAATLREAMARSSA